jgi:hypothetical protein
MRPLKQCRVLSLII